MAAVGSGVSEVVGLWLLSPGVVTSFILLLLLSVLLTTLCSDCHRRSFDLQDDTRDKNPPALISVVKLEETATARENPAFTESQSDERESSSPSVTPWRSHLRATEIIQESSAEEDFEYPLWRSHLRGPVQQEGRSNADNLTPPPRPNGSVVEAEAEFGGKNSVYAQVSKKVKQAPPLRQEEEEEEEEPTPPLPVREMEMAG